jgi:hypothetical protein
LPNEGTVDEFLLKNSILTIKVKNDGFLFLEKKLRALKG